jgi:iron complex outermembrane receptor protein
LTIAPTERVRNEMVYDYFDSDSENTVAVISGLLPFTGAPPPFIPIEFLYAGNQSPVAIGTGVGTIQAFTGGAVPVGNTTAFYNAYFSDPTHPAGGIRSFLDIQNARGPFRVGADSNNIFVAQNHIVTNRTIFELSDNIELRNIFGFSRVKAILGQDADGTPYRISQSGQTKLDQTGLVQDNDQVSNEIQLVGDAFNGRLDFVTGFYYAKEKRVEKQFSTFFDILFGGQTQNNEYIIRSETMAGYAQGTLAITDSGLSVTVGARYTSEDVGKETLPTDAFRIALGENPVLPGVNYDQKANYKNWSYQLGVQQQIDDLLLYAVHRRAYKSGGFNTTLAPVDAIAAFGGDIYGDERVQDVEFGAKFAGLLGTTPARANFAVYKSWVNDSQRTAYSLVLGNPSSLTVNIPKGTVLGAELDGSFDPVEWLRLGGSVNYTDAKYTDGNVIANGAAQVFDIVPDTPKYSGTAFADITLPVSTDINVVLHGNVYGQTKTFTTPRSANSFGTRIDGYVLANFRIGLENDAAGWSLTANLKNAFNKAFFAGGLPTGEIYQINTLVPGEPRTFTVQARFKF